MSSESHPPPPPDSIREHAERRLAETDPIDLETLTPEMIQSLIHEMEVHKIELNIQNEQLREAQRAAVESNERFRNLYDSAPTGFLTVDFDGLILEANRSIAQILKTPHNGLIGRRLSSLVASHCQDRLRIALVELSTGQERKDLMLTIALPGSGAIDLQVVGVLAAAGGMRPNDIHLALIDVTDLRRIERALQVAVTAVAQAEERERQKLASDLHDDAGQLLVLASIKLRALGDAPEEERRALEEELENLLVEVRSRISSLSFQLSPPLLRDVGLVAALHWLAEDLAKSYGLKVKVVEEQELKLNENTRIAFFRAIRELLLNVVKHAGVKEATIHIARIGEMARISVEDAGVGIPPLSSRRGFGLLALRDRIEQLGGSVGIFGSPKRGTTIAVSIPNSLENDDQEGAR